MKVLITGVSGTGKTAVCRELEKRGVKTIGIDETSGLSYWVHKETKEKLVKKTDFTQDFLAAHEWVCDMDLLSSLTAENDEPIVITGNVENILEVIKFCDVTLLLVCSPETFFARIDTRADNEYGQSKDTKNFILSYYERDNTKCIDAGAVAIDAEQSLDNVVQDILEYIN